MPKVTVTEQKSSATEDTSKALTGERKAYFKETGAFLDTRIYDGGTLAPGSKVPGPAIVEEPGTTIVIPPNWKASVTGRGDYLLEYTKDPPDA